MMDEPPALLPPPPPPQQVVMQAEQPAQSLTPPPPSDRVVIDLMQLAPAPLAEPCEETVADPLNAGIVVCTQADGPSPRLGPMVGPVDEEAFGSAIPRARIKLSDKAAAEANVHNTPVGGFNANGGEVRLKIDF